MKGRYDGCVVQLNHKKDPPPSNVLTLVMTYLITIHYNSTDRQSKKKINLCFCFVSPYNI